ncbi:TlpA family protein disulfide reductase [bacterium]|nr:TlpA family protein disulfide reductase [bacterium]
MKQIFSAIVIMLMMVSIFSCGKKEAGLGGAVDFSITDLEGNSVKLSEYRGKTVLVNVWATWCAPCIKEIPDLKEIHAEYKDSNVVVLGVLLESQSPEAAKPMVVDQLQINYPTWYGDDAFAKQFQIQAFPTTIIIDKNGKVVSRNVGLQNKERFLNLLKAAGI